MIKLFRKKARPQSGAEERSPRPADKLPGVCSDAVIWAARSLWQKGRRIAPAL